MPCLAQTQVLAYDFARTEEHIVIETWQRLLKHHHKKGFRMANAYDGTCQYRKDYPLSYCGSHVPEMHGLKFASCSFWIYLTSHSFWNEAAVLGP